MISFESDYITGAHPKILESLAETNFEPLKSYGKDKYSESAAEKIKKACGLPDAEVELLTGGTQTNAIVIAALLKDFEGVIAARSGHINGHEAGAVEYSGHKVLELPQKDGKIDTETLKNYLEAFESDRNREHMVFPGMVYISYPTEYGTLYTKEELTEISEISHAHGLTLYADGARLGYGLMSREADLTLAEFAHLTDVFYIGGTKVGALCGEAVVFTKHNRPPHFMNFIKKRGALLAKGRLLGVQFDALFTDDLYFEISRHAINEAERLKEVLRENGLRLSPESPTNQQFVILENKQAERLAKEVAFAFWEKYDSLHTVYRFATCWSTTDDDIKALSRALKGCL